MPSIIAKALQRVQGLVWGDGVRDDAVYFDGHSLIVDLVGRDATAGLVIRGLSVPANVPSVVFQVNKDGSWVLASGMFAAPGNSAVGDAAATGTAATINHSDHVHGRESFGLTAAVVAVGLSSSQGSSVSPARIDHRHQLAAVKATAQVLTLETTTSTSFANLTTPGPAITLSPGYVADHVLWYSSDVFNSAVGGNSFISPSIASAAASDNDSAQARGQGSTTVSRETDAANIADGATHSLQYRVASDTGSFERRRITGIAC